jgi:hypothetical protein
MSETEPSDSDPPTPAGDTILVIDELFLVSSALLNHRPFGHFWTSFVVLNPPPVMDSVLLSAEMLDQRKLGA